MRYDEVTAVSTALIHYRFALPSLEASTITLCLLYFVASAMIMTILSGTMKAGSIFFVEIQNVFGASRANTALIFGIYSLVTMLTCK